MNRTQSLPSNAYSDMTTEKFYDYLGLEIEKALQEN